jgi:iron complex outermembrane receptor protein
MYYVTARYKVFGEALQIYGDLLSAKTKQDNGLAASPFTIFSGAANASPYNPFRPATLTSIQYRTVRELGLRRQLYDVDQWRYVAGINGSVALKGNDFLSFIGYDTGIVYDRQDYLTVGSGDLRRSQLETEIRAGNFNPFIGLNAPLAGTIPAYFHGVPTGISQSYDNVAAAQRAAYTSRSNYYGKSFLADARIFGNLLPWLYQGGIAFNVGFEYRYGRSSGVPDPILVQGDQLGFNPESLSKSEGDATSYFGEIQVPLVVSTMNVPGVRSLEFSAAYRHEQFEDMDLLTTSSASTDNGGTPRFTLRYQPMIDLTLRASYGRSFSPPGGAALLGPQSDSFALLYDPLLGRVVGLRLIGGGNPLLQPENTDTYTAGMVLTPRVVPGFTMTLDFYQIVTDGLILGSGEFGQLVLTANGRSGGIAFADLVEREEGTNIPLVVHGVTSNAGKRLVNGMDITATYELPTQSFGKFTWSLGYNYFFTWKAEPIAGLGTTSFLGNFTGTVPLAPGAVPYHKGFLRGEWEWKGVDFVATMNYISSFNDDSSSLADSNIIGGTDTNPQWDTYRRVSDYITLDMQLSYEFTKHAVQSASASSGKDGKNVMTTSADGSSSSIWQRMLWDTKLTVGVNNAFDRNPPTVLGAFNDNYDTSLYSIRNRYYYVSINKKF